MELHREGQRHSPDSMPNPRQILRDIHAKVARRKMSKNIVVEQKLRQNLVIVCCHAIWKGKGDCGDAEDEWLIEPFQKGEIDTFVQHIQEGLDCLKKDKKSVLVFSGGRTKQNRTNLAEGQSYMNFARQELQAPQAWSDRIFAENYATDSFQNLLFSIILFKYETGDWPQHITIVSHAFKRNRFVNCHCIAIYWPLSRVTFKGINPPEHVTPKAVLTTGESKAVDVWAVDRYGVGDVLGAKRRQRGWDPRDLARIERGPYAHDDVDINDHDWIIHNLGHSVHHLMRYDGGPGGRHMFPFKLPWMSDQESGVSQSRRPGFADLL